MSFVRSGRELQTVDAFPRSPHDVASGLGNWPLLQTYAYHWGIEVRFQPDLDEAFGITNDKQGVRPIEDFWRALVLKEIDKAVHRSSGTRRRRASGRRPTTLPPAEARAPPLQSKPPMQLTWRSGSARGSPSGTSLKPATPQSKRQSSVAHVRARA